MIIILVNSLTTGLVTNTQDNFEIASGGHIYITGEVILDSGKKVNRIEDTEVLDAVMPQFEPLIKEYQKRSMITGSFIFRSKEARSVLYGVHWEEEEALVEMLRVVEGSLDRRNEPGTIVVPKNIAEELGVVLGEQVLIRFNTVTGQANVGEFTIIALTEDATGLGFDAAYADISYVNELVGLQPHEYQSYNLVLNNIQLVNTVTQQIKQAIADQGAVLKPEPTAEEEMTAGMGMRSMFGSSEDNEPWEGTRFDVSNLNEFMDVVTQIVAILNGIALGMFLLMLTITMVGLVNTFRMIMIERVKEIGTMRSVGMLKKQVSRLFIFEGLILALRGALFGILAAFVIGLIISLIPFPDGSNFAILLSEGHISVPIVPSSILMVTAIIAVITLVAVWSPARKAAKLQPADALRS
jgi:putative ABC transport system permease protein